MIVNGKQLDAVVQRPDGDLELFWIDRIETMTVGQYRRRFANKVMPQVLAGVHDRAICRGRPCAIHNPSKTHMREWDLNWRDDRGLMERICKHGVGHPDPDHLWYVEHASGAKAAQVESVHGCDGCCVPPGERGQTETAVGLGDKARASFDHEGVRDAFRGAIDKLASVERERAVRPAPTTDPSGLIKVIAHAHRREATGDISVVVLGPCRCGLPSNIGLVVDNFYSEVALHAARDIALMDAADRLVEEAEIDDHLPGEDPAEPTLHQKVFARAAGVVRGMRLKLWDLKHG